MKKILSAAMAVGLLVQPILCNAEAASAENPPLNPSAVESPIESPVPTESPIAATAEASETPILETAAPEAPASASPTAEAPDPEATPSEAPQTPAPEATSETETPAPVEPTQTPEAEASKNPDVIEASSRSEIPAGAQAWSPAGDVYLCGSLEAVVRAAKAGAEIRIQRAEILQIKAAPLKHMASLKLLPDEGKFSDGAYRILISEESPAAAAAPEALDPAQWAACAADETMDLFVWVEKIEATPTPVAPETIQIEVRSDDYRAAEWSNVHPIFELSGMPDEKNWAYAAVIYDERIAVLSEGRYAAEAEGVYTLRFVILDALGDIADASETYTLYLDHTPPEVSAYVDSEADYTLHIDMADGISGLSGLSLDGGASWMDLGGAESDTYTICEKAKFAAGAIQVRDLAGNIWISDEAYELKKLPSGGGGGGGGSGSGAPAKQHAAAEAGEADTGAAYNALSMHLSDAPMHNLTIDDQPLALTLELANAEGFEIPSGYQPMFTAELAAWAADHDHAPAEGEAAPDTLLLKAIPEENLGDRFEYRWKFNGEVYRLLANSGIRYIALCIGNDMAVFPTDGFTGGTKYTELKMLGVSTRKFDYTVAMNFNLDPDRIPKFTACDFSESCDMAVQAEVENARYVLSDASKGEMYYERAYLGPMEMMDFPYGSYGAAGDGQ